MMNLCRVVLAQKRMGFWGQRGVRFRSLKERKNPARDLFVQYHAQSLRNKTVIYTLWERRGHEEGRDAGSAGDGCRVSPEITGLCVAHAVNAQKVAD